MRNFFSRTTIHMSIFEFIWFPGSDMRRQKKWEIHWKFVAMKRTHTFLKVDFFAATWQFEQKFRKLMFVALGAAFPNFQCIWYIWHSACAQAHFFVLLILFSYFHRLANGYYSRYFENGTTLSFAFFFPPNKMAFVRLKFAPFFWIFDKNSSFNYCYKLRWNRNVFMIASTFC